jgi:DNA-binding transcriptional MerR regulator
MTAFSPAQTAELSGFSLDTLRYYERIGLLNPVDRAVGGQRRYSAEDLEWLDWLRCLRATGMPVAQMQQFAEQVRGGDATIADRLALLVEHEHSVTEQISQLERQRTRLREKIDYYRGLVGE